MLAYVQFSSKTSTLNDSYVALLFFLIFIPVPLNLAIFIRK